MKPRHRRRRSSRVSDRANFQTWRNRALAGSVVLSGIGIAAPVSAQEWSADDLLGSLQRVIDDSSGAGMRVGSAIVAPTIAVLGGYDSNVFAAPDHEKSDFYTTLVPSVAVQSDWPRHAFSLKATGEFRQYATYSRENTNNFSIAGTGRFDLAPNAYILAGGGYQLLHEDRDALVPIQGVDPTQYTVTSGKAAFVVEPAPMGLRLDATVDSYAYNDVDLFDGTTVGETARDHIVYALAPRVTYRIQPEYDAFLGAVVNRRQYNNTREPDGLNRSSTGGSVRLGTSFDLTQYAFGEFYAGYLVQNYDAKGAKSINAADFGGKLEWRPIPGTAIRFTLSRSIEESTLLGSPGYLQTSLRIAVEHELFDRVLLLGSVGFINADFSGASASSNLYDLKLGVRYLLSGNLSADLEYDIGHRASNAPLPSYTRQIVELRLRGQL
ncbi:MAG TPA: outer membrane beta-barrel protein [Stellaceae bacterium]|nr:outer membrane beta-barrel protein [Stellaceae bacterium]